MSNEKKEVNVAEIVKEAISQALPAAVAVAVQTQNAQRMASPEVLVSGNCEDCGQPIIKGKWACNKKHRKIEVWPKESENHFEGVAINHVWYRSNGPGHLITVPEDANIEYMLAQRDQAEKEAREGRKRKVKDYMNDFRARHSGSM